MSNQVNDELIRVGAISWDSYPETCRKYLGYTPESDTKLSKNELHKLGFTYAAGTKQLVSHVYGRIIYLL